MIFLESLENHEQMFPQYYKQNHQLLNIKVPIGKGVNRFE